MDRKYEWTPALKYMVIDEKRAKNDKLQARHDKLEAALREMLILIGGTTQSRDECMVQIDKARALLAEEESQ